MPESSSPVRIAFVTVCKGRLDHLKQTLPLIAAQTPDEITVVDWDCPQGTADWVEANFPQAKAVRVTGRPEFNLATGRNIGARATTASWICFLDADNAIAPGFVEWLRRNLREGCFYIPNPAGMPLDTVSEGMAVCHRRAFRRVEGYDEIICGWGGEDTDFCDRLALCNVAKIYFPAELVSSIPHGDDERTRFYAIKRREVHQMLNRTYRIAKHHAMHVLAVRTELAIDIRRNLYKEISKAFAEWMADPSAPLPSVTISVTAQDPLTKPFRLLKKSSFTITLK